MPQPETLALEAETLPTTDVLIVGGGVCGTALLFVLARYTTLSHLTLVERYGELAQVNSRASSNSQTIHCGDIETNYTLEKALKVKRIAGMIGRYASQLPPGRALRRAPSEVTAHGPSVAVAFREVPTRADLAAAVELRATLATDRLLLVALVGHGTP
ncbi:MAG: malate:quinone oxidoreductase, partial [Cyanobium sp.]